jgi:NCAIR mutase (PurE)-related protein
LLATRAALEHFKAVKRKIKNAHYHQFAKIITANEPKSPEKNRGTILIISAGTSDIPVAEEAAITAQMMSNPTEKLYDVGVAGIHRLLSQSEKLTKANVVIVVAGMEGALPSVVGGLVDVPVIAVPTSIGYGASFGGVAALLGMLNSCASGVTVVNIDNGFGAGFAASLMNRK